MPLPETPRYLPVPPSIVTFNEDEVVRHLVATRLAKHSERLELPSESGQLFAWEVAQGRANRPTRNAHECHRSLGCGEEAMLREGADQLGGLLLRDPGRSEVAGLERFDQALKMALAKL